MKLTIKTCEKLMKKQGGSLIIGCDKRASLPDNLTVAGFLDLSFVKITSLPNNLTVGGALDLRCSQIASLPDNLTVGGSLDLEDTSITSLPDNLTVGGSLYLRGTKIASLPNNLTVGRGLHVEGSKITEEETKKVNKLKDGDYKKGAYVYADRILTHVKFARKYGNYTYYYGKIKGQNVVSDGTHFAHCKTFKEGVIDIAFKRAKDRGADQYKGLSLDEEFTPEEAITMYRVITGACGKGSERFVNSLGKLKDKYTLREIIDTTQGQYGSSTFENFFKE